MAWWPRSATMSEVPIHLRVPAAIKGRWVQASRAARMRLTDWITVAVEAYMSQQLARAVPPPGLVFADLRLAREADGSVSFDADVLLRICRSNSCSQRTTWRG